MLQKNNCPLIEVKLSTADCLADPGDTNICNQNCLSLPLLNRNPLQKQIKGQD